jgi:hypothetical protein
VSAKRRALAIVATFLWERAKRKNPEWTAAWKVASPGTTYVNATLELVRSDPFLVQEEEWVVLERAIRRMVPLESCARALWGEYDLMEPVLRAAELTSLLLPNVHDYRPSDRSIIDFLGLQNYATSDAADKLLAEIGGLWHVIRTDTSKAPDEFNVSVVSIKPLVYVRPKSQSSQAVEAVVSHLPHFSMRSRGRGDHGTVQQFRGIVVRIGDVYQFLATRDDAEPHFVLMTWNARQHEQAEDGDIDLLLDEAGREKDLGEDAEGASGVDAALDEPDPPPAAPGYPLLKDALVMTINASSEQIQTPALVWRIEQDDKGVLERARPDAVDSSFVSAARKARGGKPEPGDVEEAERWRDRIAGLAETAKRYEAVQLPDLRKQNPALDVHELTQTLKDRMDIGNAGFFSFPKEG